MEYTIDKAKKQIILNFDNVLEYADFSNTIDTEIPEDELYRYRKDGHSVKFSGGTYEDAWKQIHEGNPELAKELHDKIHVMQAMIEQEQQGTIRDVEGDYFDIGEVLQGEPECWRRQEMGDVKPVVPVWCNFSMNCNITIEQIRNRGAAIVSLVDELQNQGYIVDLHIVSATDLKKSKMFINLKVDTNPVDIDEVAFLIANSLHLRRIGFAIFEKMFYDKKFSQDLKDSNLYPSDYTVSVFGYPCEYILDDLFASGLSGFYFCSSNHHKYDRSNYSTLENAKNHVLEMVKLFEESAEQVIIG